MMECSSICSWTTVLSLFADCWLHGFNAWIGNV